MLLRALALLFCFALAGPAPAQERWPARTLRIVTPAPAGVAPDIFARLFAEHLAKALGQPVVVENRPGASAILGTDVVAKAPADGYTLLYGFNSIVTMNPHLFSRLPFDPERDLQPVSQILQGDYLLVAHNEFPGKSVKEMLDQGREQPGRIPYASYGPGSASDLGFKLIEEASRTEFLHVPYRQGVTQDLIAGQVKLVIEPTGFILPFVREGKVRAIASTGTQRLRVLPDVPTLAETLPGVAIHGWHGFFVRAGTPPDVVARLHQEIVRILRLPEIDKRIRDIGFEPTGTSPEETRSLIRRESEQWGRIIRAKNIKLD
jgi:tripartite-type tricarboxylate transporter receptor subunit TctC